MCSLALYAYALESMNVSYDVKVIGFVVTSLTVIFWTVLRAYEKRETRLSTRITALESFVEKTLISLVADVKEAIVGNSQTVLALQKTTESLQSAILELIKAMDRRTCLLDVERQHEIVELVSARIADHAASAVAVEAAKVVREANFMKDK
jgi:hypothetical protein